MKINYKFNKSSEAQTCDVNNIELEIVREIDLSFNKKELKKEELIELLNSNNFAEFMSIDDIVSSLYFERYNDFYNNYIQEENRDYICSPVNRKVTGRYSYGNHEIINVSFWFKDFTIKFTAYIIEGRGEWTFSRNKDKPHYTIFQEFNNYEIKENKQFTSQQSLKDYIKTIKEELEFIGTSAIDDVLLKDWIGEWKTEKVLNNSLGNNYSYYEVVKTGTPELNSNWKFKIN